MGITKGPNLLTNNLVFGLDTGYGVADNNTATRFYKGEPTTNTVLANHSWYGDGGGVSSILVTDENLKYKGYTTYLYTPGSSDNSYLQTADFTASQASPYWTWSCYVKRQDGLPITSMGTYIYHPSSNGNANGTITQCGNGWVRIHRTVNASNAAINLAGFYSMTAAKYYLSGAMLSKTTQLAPYLKEQTSVSDTGSLIDLKRTVSIDMNTVSFDSTGQPDYDGSDDKAIITSFPHIWNSSCSLEAVAIWHDDTRSTIFGNYDQGAGGHDINIEKLTGGVLRFYWDRGARDVTSTGNPRVTTNGSKYHHVVWVRELETNSFKFYVDGTIVSTIADAGGNIASTGSTFRVGADSRDGATVHNGSIPVFKAYNIALSAEKIKQNYNTYKNRFNL